MNRVPKRWTDVAQQAFHDVLCTRADVPHEYAYCSQVGGPVVGAVDAAVDALLTVLLAEVDEESDRRHWVMVTDAEANVPAVAGELLGLLFARHMILHGERLSKDDEEK